MVEAPPVSDVVRIGVLTDVSGKGAVEAVKMAVEDFGGKVFGKNIEVVFADHQNKAWDMNDESRAFARRFRTMALA